MAAQEQDISMTDSLPRYSTILMPDRAGEKQNKPMAVVALPPTWPEYSLNEDIDLRTRRASIYLFSNAALLVVDAVVSDGEPIDTLTAHIVMNACSASSFFLFSIGTVSAVSALLHLSQLRLEPFFVAQRHKPAPEIIAGILDKDTTSLQCRRQLLGSQRLMGLADICLGSGCVMLAIAVCAQLFADQPIAVQACAYTSFGLALVAFAFHHGFARRAGVWRGSSHA